LILEVELSSEIRVMRSRKDVKGKEFKDEAAE
jgi:hypothetical protein